MENEYPNKDPVKKKAGRPRKNIEEMLASASHTEESRVVEPVKPGSVKGPFTAGEINYIKANVHRTDAEIARDLGRKQCAVSSFRLRNKIQKVKGAKNSRDKGISHRDSFLGSLSDTERRLHLSREVRSSSRYRGLVNAFTPDELEIYVEKYVDFMMDPTIETMTTMEKDSLHQVFINEIRINRFLAEEQEDKKMLASTNQKRMPISRAKEIKECQDLILRAHKSLDVEREQRLKNQSDQSINFINLIRDLKDPANRKKAGQEAAMLRYIAQKDYNSRLGKNILSGKNTKYDMDSCFVNNQDPNLSADFIPLQRQQEKQEQSSPSGIESGGSSVDKKDDRQAEESDNI